jgi:hypothetical protein
MINGYIESGVVEKDEIVKTVSRISFNISSAET